jgi:hypothetical protein
MDPYVVGKEDQALLDVCLTRLSLTTHAPCNRSSTNSCLPYIGAGRHETGRR